MRSKNNVAIGRYMQNFHDEMKIASSGNKRNKVFALLEPEIKVGAQLMPAVKYCTGSC